MADNIQTYINRFKQAVYGEDVRDGIVAIAQFLDSEYNNIKDVADSVRGLIIKYEQAKSDVQKAIDNAKAISGTLKEQIQTGTTLKNDLSGLSNSLSDGRDVLAQLKTENTKATTALTEAREKIPVLQDLLSRIPDLQDAQRIATALDTAYDNASQALEELNGLTAKIDQLKALNSEAAKNLADYEKAKADVEQLKKDIAQLGEDTADYPQVIEDLRTAYQNANDALQRLTNVEGTITQLAELNDQAESNLQAYTDAETKINELVEKTTQLESTVTGYPEIVQALEDAYQKVSEKTYDLEELNRLLSEIENNVKIIQDNKANIDLVVQNIEIIKKLGEADLSKVLELESRVQALEGKEDLTPRVQAIETTLDGLAETLETLI